MTARVIFIPNNDFEVSEALVKHGVSIGVNATIRCGFAIGEYAMVGSGSVVTKDVSAHALVVGNPARQIGWVCRCGGKLDGDCQCPICGAKYEELSVNGGVVE